MQHYKNHFKDKVVFCNCDDARISNFFKYFSSNFKELGLKKLIVACYQEQKNDLFNTEETENGFFFECTGKEGEKDKPNSNDIVYFKGDGDFRSSESIELLKQSDIVVTNPPFSLFREYVAQLVKYDKKFLIILIRSNPPYPPNPRSKTNKAYPADADARSTSESSEVYSRFCDVATASYVSFPAYVLTPSRRPASSAIAFSNPLFARSRAYGRVAFVRANVDVRGTAPGMFATQ